MSHQAQTDLLLDYAWMIGKRKLDNKVADLVNKCPTPSEIVEGKSSFTIQKRQRLHILAVCQCALVADRACHVQLTCATFISRLIGQLYKANFQNKIINEQTDNLVSATSSILDTDTFILCLVRTACELIDILERFSNEKKVYVVLTELKKSKIGLLIGLLKQLHSDVKSTSWITERLMVIISATRASRRIQETGSLVLHLLCCGSNNRRSIRFQQCEYCQLLGTQKSDIEDALMCSLFNRSNRSTLHIPSIELLLKECKKLMSPDFFQRLYNRYASHIPGLCLTLECYEMLREFHLPEILGDVAVNKELKKLLKLILNNIRSTRCFLFTTRDRIFFSHVYHNYEDVLSQFLNIQSRVDSAILELEFLLAVDFPNRRIS
ncbi:hypothetical protein ACOME3_009557 [Neoechinorhynchus agilis]